MFLHVRDYVNGARSPQRSVKYLAQRPSRLLVQVHAACAAGNPAAVVAVWETVAHVRKVDQDGHPGARRANWHAARFDGADRQIEDIDG